ncbi:hypothetical protein INR49_032252 [Caranx melampygus]|nr:hypothetical protein INR49_032252 [Caranx melampygus]
MLASSVSMEDRPPANRNGEEVMVTMMKMHLKVIGLLVRLGGAHHQWERSWGRGLQEGTPKHNAAMFAKLLSWLIWFIAIATLEGAGPQGVGHVA